MSGNGNIKVLVAGHFNSGKTTLVKTLTDAITTEKKVSDPEEIKKKLTTTVSMDYGKFDMLSGKSVAIFGVPGQERFSFMWKALSRGVSGYIFMLDSSDPPMWQETMRQIDVFMGFREVPYIIAANKQDLENARDVEYISKTLGIDRSTIVPCIATDRDHAMRCLGILLSKLSSTLGRVR